MPGVNVDKAGNPNVKVLEGLLAKGGRQPTVGLWELGGSHLNPISSFN